jgi:hypothetical protein
VITLRVPIPSASAPAWATTVPTVSITLDEALDSARTGDVWVFRGRKAADRAIQVATNSPVSHVGMSVVIGDLPPLTWHAELGRSLSDLWSGTRHRGVQLHDLRQAVMVWSTRYGQLAWPRQLDRPATSEMQDAVLRTIARMERMERHAVPLHCPARLAVAARRVPAVRRQTGGADLGVPAARRCSPSPTGPWDSCPGHGTPARQARAWLA